LEKLIREYLFESFALRCQVPVAAKRRRRKLQVLVMVMVMEAIS